MRAAPAPRAHTRTHTHTHTHTRTHTHTNSSECKAWADATPLLSAPHFSPHFRLPSPTSAVPLLLVIQLVVPPVLPPRVFPHPHLLHRFWAKRPLPPMPDRAWAEKRCLRAEVGLLQELAAGKKTFEQVKSDALKFAFAGTTLKNLARTNASRGIKDRLKQLTGIGEDTLDFFPLRRQGGAKGHPFSLLHKKIQNLLADDPGYFTWADAGDAHGGGEPEAADGYDWT